MAFPGNSEVDLVLALQDGAVHGGRWSGFLARLARLTGARFAAMISRVPDLSGHADIAAAMPSQVPMPVDATALSLVLTERMRPERIYAEAELADLIAGGNGHELDDALVRLGAISVTALRVTTPAVTFALGIFGSHAFDAADGAVLRRLFPFLQAAARTAAQIWHAQLRATLTADLARQAGLGWFLIDHRGVVLDAWTATPHVSDTVKIRPGAHGDRLALAERAAEPALAAIVERFAADRTSAPRALWVSHDPPLHLRIAPIPREWAFDPRGPAALATLHGESRLSPDGALLLVDLFGLLPSEARLAAALANGESLAGAATRLGLTIETARNYSKKIFAKTGTRGQADLVRRVLSFGLATPAGPWAGR